VLRLALGSGGLGLAGAGALSGCGAGQHSGAQGAEQRSLAEYDVARDLWFNRNQPRAALGHALSAHDLNDDNSDVEHLVALLYLALCEHAEQDCRLNEAEQFAARALELKPDFREARNTLGVVQLQQAHYDRAIATLKPLTEDMLYATPEIAWGNLGWAYLQRGDLERALSALERSTLAQPDFCVGHYRLGVTYERAGRFEEAVKSYGLALSSAGGRCRGLQAAYAGRSVVLQRLGRGDEARADARECLRLAPDTPDGKRCASLASAAP
jgi:type IV pilus assembly protein PilF